MRTKKTISQRFQEKSFPEPNTGCWLWGGSCNDRGYGYMKSVLLTERLAHRISFKLFVGAIPDGMNILHRCDNPPCVNPDHLFLGDQKLNVDDMIKKGRHRNKYTGKMKNTQPNQNGN